MNRFNCVYLDHLIPREPFLYKSSQQMADPKSMSLGRITLLQLVSGGENRDGSRKRNFRRLLRKPDFQRATQAWTPQQCVDLVESIFTQKVIPSVILWLSPDNFIYVLDGGHRISVLLAYITDDWGDGDAKGRDLKELERSQKLAQETRYLLQIKGIASFAEHERAGQIYWQLFDRFEGDQQKIIDAMQTHDLKLANQMRGWETADIGFPIQWVTGGYTDAEESFLRINTSGTNLSEWEIKLVRYRKSSFARLVTSVANTSYAERCWPTRDEETPLSEDQQAQVQSLIQKAKSAAQLLFEPREADKSGTRRPLLIIPAATPELAPAYTGEVLAVVSGQAGRPEHTEALMQRDISANAAAIIANGATLSQELLEALQHFRGPTSRSLGIISAAYFYNPEGTPVRSLFYGFLFWINYGTTGQIIARKQAFCAFRRSFETVLMEKKREIITRISRRLGSGGEVTIQTARYFNGLLDLLIEHNGQHNTPNFQHQHDALLENFRKASSDKEGGVEERTARQQTVSNARIASPNQRTRLQLEHEFARMEHCSLCGGLLDLTDPDAPVQFDHIHKHSEGGQTADSNLRPLHPFCNNHRDVIESIVSNQQKASLPAFVDATGQNEFLQLFLPFWDADDYFDAEGVEMEDLTDVTPQELELSLEESNDVASAKNRS